MTKGVFWIAVAKYSGIIVSLVVTAILARHVSPSAFGTMAIATVIMAFLDIFSDMGLGVAIVQFKDLTLRQVQSLFSVSIVLAVVLTALLFLVSGCVAQYYDDILLTDIIRWLCVCLFFKALNIIPNGLMLKNKRFRDIAVRTLLFQVISGVIACWMALTGWGIYALLISPIISSIGVFAYNYYNYPQYPVWPMERSVIKKVWSYSMYQFLFSVINYFSRNADKLIIGKFFSMKELGYYEKSYRLMQLPLQNITFVVTPVLHPILSSLQNDKEQLASKNIKLTQILSWISFPLGIILFFCASPIIKIIFGNNWIPAIPVFKILAFSVPLQMMTSTAGSIFQAAGKTNHLFYCGLQSSICTVGAFILSAKYFGTIESMAWAWDVASCFNFVFAYWFMYKFTFDNSSIRIFLTLIPQLINSIIVAIIAYLAIKFWTPIDPIVEILWSVIVTIGPTLIMGVILHQYSIKGLFGNILNRLD